MAQEQRCKHSACRCTAGSNRPDGFCSDSCKSRSETGGKCQCGHQDCK
jgi:hypothetical protein